MLIKIISLSLINISILLAFGLDKSGSVKAADEDTTLRVKGQVVKFDEEKNQFIPASEVKEVCLFFWNTLEEKNNLRQLCTKAGSGFVAPVVNNQYEFVIPNAKDRFLRWGMVVVKSDNFYEISRYHDCPYDHSVLDEIYKSEPDYEEWRPAKSDGIFTYRVARNVVQRKIDLWVDQPTLDLAIVHDDVKDPKTGRLIAKEMALGYEAALRKVNPFSKMRNFLRVEIVGTTSLELQCRKEDLNIACNRAHIDTLKYKHAPDSIIVVVHLLEDGKPTYAIANTSGETSFVRAIDGYGVWTHELGHTLSLGDEYRFAGNYREVFCKDFDGNPVFNHNLSYLRPSPPYKGTVDVLDKHKAEIKWLDKLSPEIPLVHSRGKETVLGSAKDEGALPQNKEKLGLYLGGPCQESDKKGYFTTFLPYATPTVMQDPQTLYFPPYHVSIMLKYLGMNEKILTLN